MNPFGYLLSFVHWELFCTFTFEGQNLPHDGILWQRMWGYLDVVRLRWSNLRSLEHLTYALRFEHGEIGKRPHFHALIAGLGKQKPSINLCFAMMARWEEYGNGFARIRVYDPGQSGADYIVKGGFGSSAINGMNVYEVGKFGSRTVDKLELSPALWSTLCVMRSVPPIWERKLFV